MDNWRRNDRRMYEITTYPVAMSNTIDQME